MNDLLEHFRRDEQNTVALGLVLGAQRKNPVGHEMGRQWDALFLGAEVLDGLGEITHGALL